MRVRLSDQKREGVGQSGKGRDGVGWGEVSGDWAWGRRK